ncbi:MAG: choice-of-anchor tandem repeat GloVer-containing protein [Steroidobacteraceae bacterium]
MQASTLPLRLARGILLQHVLPAVALVWGAVGAQAGEPVNLINVHSFPSSVAEGINPRGDLLLDAADGNFYGTTHGGGTVGAGTVYRMLPTGELGVLHSFAGAPTEGANPYAGVVKGTDGSYYGTTYSGGAKQAGTVYKVAGDGTFSTLHSFSTDKRGGYFPYTGVVQGSDGNFYGTTLRGGANDMGTVFKMDTAGTLTQLYEFKGSDGSNPEGALVVGPDGALYGTTALGGTSDRGSVYKITTSGTLTTIYSFATLGAFNAAGVATNPDGANPRAGLTLGTDGNFYGTAYQGGTEGLGTVFRLTPAGMITTLHAFAGAPNEGAGPLSGVTRDIDGTLYGTTERGGGSGQGTAWRITPAGVFQHLHAFTGLGFDGATPYATLVPSGGFIYGVTYSDSTLRSGSAFKLDPGTGGVLPVTITTTPATIAVGAGATLSWSAPAATGCTAAGAWSDTIAVSGTKALAPTDAGRYTYLLSCTDADGVVRNAQSVFVVTAPSAKPVDAGATTGGGGGALGGVALLLLSSFAGLRVRKRLLG